MDSARHEQSLRGGGTLSGIGRFPEVYNIPNNRQVTTDWISTAITGAVGIAGIAGTYLSLQTQRRHSVEDRVRAERKAVFTEYLAAGSRLGDLILRANESPSEGDKIDLLREAKELVGRLTLLLQEIYLVGTESVGFAANDHTDYLLATFMTLVKTGRPPKGAGKKIAEHRVAVMQQMRRALRP